MTGDRFDPWATFNDALGEWKAQAAVGFLNLDFMRAQGAPVPEHVHVACFVTGDVETATDVLARCGVPSREA